MLTNFELFDFNYVCDDPVFKAELEENIKDHFFFYEIASETPDRFKHKFRTKFQRIMPYYNKLHNLTLLEYDPLTNYTLVERLEQLANTTANEQRTGTDNKKTNYSDSTDRQTENDLKTTDTSQNNTTATNANTDFPQTPTVGSSHLTDAGQAQSDTSASGQSTNTGTVTNVDSSEGTNEDNATHSQEADTTQTTNTNYEKTIEGMTGITYQELIQLEREGIQRITNQIINEMKSCFMLVW